MRKLYIVRLTEQERVELQGIVKKLKGTGQKVRRAHLLLKAESKFLPLISPETMGDLE
jgi:hypothetical protein